MGFLDELKKSLAEGKPSESLTKTFYEGVERAETITNDPAALKEVVEKDRKLVEAVKPLTDEERKIAEEKYIEQEAKRMFKEAHEMRDAQIKVYENEIEVFKLSIESNLKLIEDQKSAKFSYEDFLLEARKELEKLKEKQKRHAR